VSGFPQGDSGVGRPVLLKLVELLERHFVDGGQSIRIGDLFEDCECRVHVRLLADATHQPGRPRAESGKRVRPSIVFELEPVFISRLTVILRLLAWLCHKPLLARTLGWMLGWGWGRGSGLRAIRPRAS